jgi:hypothetical protein
MDDQVKAAFEAARESTKQLITLSTGVLTLEITFVQKMGKTCWLLPLSWGCLLLSVACGVWTLLALTGTLAPMDNSTPVSIRGLNVTIPSIIQIILFILGLSFTVAFGFVAL